MIGLYGRRLAKPIRATPSIRFRDAPPSVNYGAGDGDSLTFIPDHSMGPVTPQQVTDAKPKSGPGFGWGMTG
jgi:hypothetical protein